MENGMSMVKMKQHSALKPENSAIGISQKSPNAFAMKAATE